VLAIHDCLTHISRGLQLRQLVGLSGNEATQYLFDNDEMEEIKMYQDLSIPDNIVKAFDQQYPVHGFIGQEKLDTKRTIEYKYNNVTYTATVYNYLYGWPDTNRQLTIKLSHDGFRYHRRKFLASNLIWHGCDSFFILDHSVLNDMPFVRELKERLKAKTIVYYSIKHRRMDIRFKDTANKPILMITFEPGAPTNFINEDDFYI
jgi:hypothetical protein